MSIENVVKRIFIENTDYNTAKLAVNQAASLNYLSTDLYQDSKRFVYELLQNADDSAVSGKKVRVIIKLFGSRLLVAHDGKAFDERDVNGITGVDDGAKKEDMDKTGFKGIGFKAVFGQSEKVYVYSQGEYFRFDASYSHEWRTAWGESKEAWEAQSRRKFEMPWQLIPIYTSVDDVNKEIHQFLTDGKYTVGTIIELKDKQGVKGAVNELASKANMYLFLKNIEELIFVTDSTTKITIGQNPSLETIIRINDVERAKWLKKTIIIEIPKEKRDQLKADKDIPEKLRMANKIEIALAAKINENGLVAVDSAEKLLYAYLPTEENDYNIPVLVNAAFYTVANRERLHKDSIWNKWLFSCIPSVLIEWIAELIVTSTYDAYNLLPEILKKVDPLASIYNSSIGVMVTHFPFVINTEGKLLKAGDAIIDLTSLSEKVFFGASPVKVYIAEKKERSSFSTNPFVASIGYTSKLRKMGVACFDWTDLPLVLSRADLMNGYSTASNLELIKYLKEVSEKDDIEKVTDNILKGWTFLMNHKNELKSPKDVFFPTADEEYDPESELSFVHEDLQDLLVQYQDLKVWLEGLGVVEKSDLTFLVKTILPNIETYITEENAIATLQNIYNLYSKDEIGNDILGKLGDLQVITEQGNLISVGRSYLATSYRPRLSLEPILQADIYISGEYHSRGIDHIKWKTFLLLLGVSEGIGAIQYEKELTKQRLIDEGFDANYFAHQYKPVVRVFSGEKYKDLTTLSFLDYSVRNILFAKAFWKDVIEAIPLSDLEKKATVFWGFSGYPGKEQGNKEENYLKWFVSEQECIPTTLNICLNAKKILLNNEANKIAEKYLPVFDGPELDNEWKIFFGFRSHMELEDYLLLLTKISQDPLASNQRLNDKVYNYLLENVGLWTPDERETVRSWALGALFEDVDKQYRPAVELKFYVDGDSSIFGGRFNFINLGIAAQRHIDTEYLIGLFGIEILRQSEFEIVTSDDLVVSDLKGKLEEILPFMAKLMESKRSSGFPEMYYDLQLIMENLTILGSSELKIILGQAWGKKVKVHYIENTLYVQEPWSKASVMYTLIEQLIGIFDARGYNKDLTLLLTSDLDNIIEHFNDEGLELPPFKGGSHLETGASGENTASEEPAEDIYSKSHLDYEQQWAENVKRNKELIKEHGDNTAEFLLTGLQEQKNGKDLKIYHFTHIENAVSIIKQQAIKSRYDAEFIDSAGSGIISQTDEERKKFARFYFRSKTPTQFYIQNLGRAEESISRIGSDPLCPIPVFFVIPLDEAIAQSEWSVSVGSLASPQVEFGNDIETLSKFDFDGVYKDKSELKNSRFLIAAHQEFIVKDELDLNSINYLIAVQDEAVKAALLAILGGTTPEWEAKIIVDASLYDNENPKVNIKVSKRSLDVSLSKNHGGYFLLQHSGIDEWNKVTGSITKQYSSENWLTTFFDVSAILQGNMESIIYKLFYCYKGKIWLVHTNTDNFAFDTSFVKEELLKWFESENTDVNILLQILRNHPEPAYWFKQPIGGPDRMSLEEHTLAVAENYLKYFKGRQKLFANEKEYLLSIMLHDIGKPAAVSERNSNLQHKKTLEIIDRLKEILPVSQKSIVDMKILINGDPVGKYMNPSKAFTLEESIAQILKMSQKLSIPFLDFLETLKIYYQSDAAGYQSLIVKLFVVEDSELKMTEDGSRLLFQDPFEEKFALLYETVELF